MFTTKQQTTIYHSIWSTRSNYATTWRLVIWIAIIGTCTGRINGQEITKITDTKDILDVSIEGGHGSTYTLPKGAQMWHGTPADFTYLRAKPAWFAARYDQSLRHGFMNFANRAGNTDILGTLQDTIDAAVKTGDKVKIEKAWTDALNHPIFFEDGVARTKPIKLIIKSCKPNVDLKLLFLNYDDAKNVAKFKQVVGTKKTDGSQIYNKAGLIGELSTNVINAVQHPDSQFCTLYNGWRNPFDQDEIMICPNVLYNIICMYQDEIVLAEYYKICGSFFPVAFNQEANVVSGVRQQRNWMHVVGNPQCKLTYEEAKKLPAKVRVGDKYDNQAFEDLWNDRPRPLSAILAVGGKATLAPPAQAKPVIAANKGKPGPLVSLLQQHQRFKIRRQQQTLQP